MTAGPRGLIPMLTTPPAAAPVTGMSPVLVVKPLPGADRYVLWSTSAGAPLFAGNRADTAAELTAAWKLTYDTVPAPGHDVESRLARADQQGTSAMYPATDRVYGWQQHTFTIRQHPGPPGPRTIARARLAEYATRVTQQQNAAALALTSEAVSGDMSC